MDNILLYTKLISLPENAKSEVSDFMDYLLNKTKNNATKKKPKFGSGKGMMKMKKNFDDPIEDFNAYM